MHRAPVSGGSGSVINLALLNYFNIARRRAVQKWICPNAPLAGYQVFLINFNEHALFSAAFIVDAAAVLCFVGTYGPCGPLSVRWDHKKVSRVRPKAALWPVVKFLMHETTVQMNCRLTSPFRLIFGCKSETLSYRIWVFVFILPIFTGIYSKCKIHVKWINSHYFFSS
jgi:hypothetical protein